jgi:hypothetical protein
MEIAVNGLFSCLIVEAKGNCGRRSHRQVAHALVAAAAAILWKSENTSICNFQRHPVADRLPVLVLISSVSLVVSIACDNL